MSESITPQRIQKAENALRRALELRIAAKKLLRETAHTISDDHAETPSEIMDRLRNATVEPKRVR